MNLGWPSRRFRLRDRALGLRESGHQFMIFYRHEDLPLGHTLPLIDLHGLDGARDLAADDDPERRLHAAGRDNTFH
jgi:hypothetical protein